MSTLLLILAAWAVLYVCVVVFMTICVQISPTDGPEQMKEVDISDELLPEPAKRSILARLEPFESLGCTFLGCYLGSESSLHATYSGVLLDETATCHVYLTFVVGRAPIEMMEVVTSYADDCSVNTNDSLKILVNDDSIDVATYPGVDAARLLAIHRARMAAKGGEPTTQPFEHPAWIERQQDESRRMWQRAIDTRIVRRRSDGRYVTRVWPTLVHVVCTLPPVRQIRSRLRIRRSNRILASLDIESGTTP